MSTAKDNRKIDTGLVFLSGLVGGVICYLIAESITPKQVASPGDHDILLANRLGFIYITMMSRAGPVALGISSALFFVLIRWAIGLTRVRVLVFEETDTQKKEDEKAVG
jgi:hypothetical protein